nr:acetyl coenzyme A C acetyltransferase [Hymenolepis microstoma]
MSDHENTDAWSSDGDSVSSESFTSSDSEPRTNDGTKSVRHLKHTGVLEGTELIDHAIDRWTTYAQLCDRGIASLRDTMVDSYVKKAIETKSRQNPSRHDSAESVNKSVAPFGDLPSLSKSLYRNNQKLAELRALHRIGRPSKRAENAKHTAATARFAIFSSNLAPWRPMGASSQKCLYRDPTISTWEYKCCKPSIPLLPYCAEHLVLAEEPAGNPLVQSQSQHQNPTTPGSPPSMPSTSSNQPDIEVTGEAGANVSQQQVLPSPTTVTSESVPSEREAALSPVGKGKLESGKPQKPTSKKSTSTKFRSGADGNTGQSEIQLIPQYLFRKCGGGPNNDCSQPVINWTDSTRCHLHTTFSNLFPLPAKKEEEGNPRMESPYSSPLHPLLREYLLKKYAPDS